MLTAERNHLGTAPVRIQRVIQEPMGWLERQLGALDEDLTTTIERSAVWQTTADLWRSLPGGGPVLACTLLAQVPALDTLSHP